MSLLKSCLPAVIVLLSASRCRIKVDASDIVSATCDGVLVDKPNCCVDPHDIQYPLW